MVKSQYTVTQLDNQWKEYTTKEKHRYANPNEGQKFGSFLTARKIAEIGKFGPEAAKESSKAEHGQVLNYYNNASTGKCHTNFHMFDQVFDSSYNYNQKLHRDDRAARDGLQVHREENSKPVPVLSSSVYGHQPEIEPNTRNFVRVAVATKGFFRDRGTGIPLHAQDI